jgi:hypothetical protein
VVAGDGKSSKVIEDGGGQNSNFVPRRDEEYLDDILIQFDEEMKLMEEEVERFLFLEEMPEIENFLFQEEELEDEVYLMEYEYTYREDGEIEEGTTTLKKAEEELVNDWKNQYCKGKRC